ncbi:hypothetical protein JKP88DRAFT_351690 [Tribonema minus]|uniref:DoxX family protein n=1 Tax=Tribonema minus TaxID=303371 RepID=A0A836C6Z9_9STRA|nr:hypothetical protein JKP88DRAFT_351690 [Tribonema minus]
MAAMFEHVCRGFFIFLFLVAGSLHFVSPYKEDMANLVPPFYWNQMHLVYVSGVMELAGGIFLCTRHYRAAAGWLLFLLINITLQAHVYAQLYDVAPMASQTGGAIPSAGVWAARNALQAAWMAMLWYLWQGGNKPATKRA